MTLLPKMIFSCLNSVFKYSNNIDSIAGPQYKKQTNSQLVTFLQPLEVTMTRSLLL